MEQNTSCKNIIRIMGAYVAWVMGSGFATGQEILQFFTSYGYKSFILVAINLVGFLIVGPAILEAGQKHRDDEGFNQFKYFCGKKIGVFYDWFVPISMFAGMVILISGAGATLQEYYGLNHYVGALVMSLLAFVAYVAGFQRFVKVVSFIGPTIIAFTIIVGVITVFRDYDGLAMVGEYQPVMEARQPVRFWWLSGLLYIAYNLTGGSMYYTALGKSAASRKEAVYGATLGTFALMLAILLMNSAMLTDIGTAGTLAIPTLYLAKKISFVLGAVFSITLICGIFSACSAMLWTVSERFVEQGTKKSYIFAGCVAVVAFLLGLLPFAELIGMIYPYLGYIGLIYVGRVAYTRIKNRCSDDAADAADKKSEA